MMRTRLSLTGKACLMLTLALFTFASISAQNGCTDELACNFDPGAVTDDGSCTYDGIFLPTVVNAGPAVRACIGSEPENYYWADQACAETVVVADPFCIDPAGSWDSLCEGDYNDCIGCEDPQWYIPYDISNGLPAVEACSPPAGYYLAPDQNCMIDVVSSDSFCVRAMWDGLCQENYDLCSIGCLGNWFIPINVGSGPAIYGCNAPAGYFLPDQQCIQELLTVDDFCVSNSFDFACMQQYSDCLLGCTDGAWYLPYQVNVGLTPVFACSAPPLYYLADVNCLEEVEVALPGAATSQWNQAAQDLYTTCTLGCADAQYYIPYQIGVLPAVLSCTDPGLEYAAADQGCVQQIIAVNPDCLNTVWDEACQDAYTECALGCDNASWSVPLEENGGPAVLSCFVPDGYWVPNQECVTQIIALDNYCVETNWDAICQEDLEDCLVGCSDAEWYIPDCPGAGPALLACSQPTGYSAPASFECFVEVIGQDPFCTSEFGAWDSLCQEVYNDCADGCTYAFACNYDPNAIFDDGSCSGYPGCTDPTATNFDANATCDNGLCTYDGATSCPGDLDGNAVVNANDLLGFLAAFGASCP